MRQLPNSEVGQGLGCTKPYRSTQVFFKINYGSGPELGRPDRISHNDRPVSKPSESDKRIRGGMYPMGYPGIKDLPTGGVGAPLLNYVDRLA